MHQNGAKWAAPDLSPFSRHVETSPLAPPARTSPRSLAESGHLPSVDDAARRQTWPMASRRRQAPLAPAHPPPQSRSDAARCLLARSWLWPAEAPSPVLRECSQSSPCSNIQSARRYREVPDTFAGCRRGKCSDRHRHANPLSAAADRAEGPADAAQVQWAEVGPQRFVQRALPRASSRTTPTASGTPLLRCQSGPSGRDEMGPGQNTTPPKEHILKPDQI